MARPIRNHGRIGDIVYDPFVGCGTTLVAAEQESRIAYCCEIEPKYVAATLERVAGIGLEPRLEIRNPEITNTPGSSGEECLCFLDRSKRVGGT
jgi:DNA modification methylase